jgi:hypothetical protein
MSSGLYDLAVRISLYVVLSLKAVLYIEFYLENK